MLWFNKHHGLHLDKYDATPYTRLNGRLQFMPRHVKPSLALRLHIRLIMNTLNKLDRSNL